MKMACLLIVFVFYSQAYAQEIPKYEGWVNDFANVISPEIRKDIREKIELYNAATGIEIAVVTVPSLQGYTVEQYTEKLFDAWGVGQKGKDNGVVLLMAPAPNERDLRIEVGYGLEGDLTDGQAGEILDNCVVNHTRGRNDRWGVGASSGIECLIAHLGTKTYQTRVQEKIEADRKRAQSAAAFSSFILNVIIVLVVAVVTMGIIFVFRTWNRLKKVQKENDTKLDQIHDRSDELSLRVVEARTVFGKTKEDCPELFLEDYQTDLEDLEDEAHAIAHHLIPSAWSLHDKLRQADAVSRKINQVDGAISTARERAMKIISLPTFIEAKKKYVKENESSIIAEHAALRTKIGDRSQFASSVSDLLCELQEQIDSCVSFVTANGPATAGSPDWLTVAEKLEEASGLIEAGNITIDQHQTVAEEAKASEERLKRELKLKIETIDKTITHKDIKESTKAEYIKHKTAAEELLDRKPDTDAEWFEFSEAISGVISNLTKVAAAISQNIVDAERARARSTTTTSSYRSGSSTGGYRSSGGGSRSSRGGGFGGFGGGRSGGGGASRKG